MNEVDTVFQYKAIKCFHQLHTWTPSHMSCYMGIIISNAASIINNTNKPFYFIFPWLNLHFFYLAVGWGGGGVLTGSQ